MWAHIEEDPAVQVLRDRERQGAAISAAHPVEPERAAAPSESTPRPAHGPCTPAAGPRCRRLTGKQPPWMSTAQNQGSQQQVFLVTLSALLKEGGASAQPMLRDPSTMRREEVQACLLDSINNPIIQAPRAGGRPRSKKIEVEKMLIAQESHAARDAKHHHAAVKITGKSTFVVYKNTLRERYNLASHWSTTHTMFWSACRYLADATRQKQVDSTPLAYRADGKKLCIFEESQEPFSAKAIKRRREQKMSQLAPGVCFLLF